MPPSSSTTALAANGTSPTNVRQAPSASIGTARRPRASVPAVIEPMSTPAEIITCSSPNESAPTRKRSTANTTINNGTGATTMLSTAASPVRLRIVRSRRMSASAERVVCTERALAPLPAGSGSRVARMHSTDQANVAALITSTVPTPKAAMSTPPRRGPISPPTAEFAMFRPFAAGRSSAGTTVGTAAA